MLDTTTATAPVQASPSEPAPAPSTPEPAPQTEQPAGSTATAAPAVIDGMLRLGKQQVAGLLQHLGFAEARSWSPAKLGKRCAAFPVMETDPNHMIYVGKLPPELRVVYDAVLDAAKKEADVDIDAKYDVGGGEPKVKKEKVKKKEKKEKKPRAGAAKKKDVGVERDAFGSAVGTRGYDAMRVLHDAENVLTMKEIVEKSGHTNDQFKGVFYNFLNEQIKRGNVRKTDKGYSITGAGRKVKAKFDEAKNSPAEETASQAPAPSSDPITAPATA